MALLGEGWVRLQKPMLFPVSAHNLCLSIRCRVSATAPVPDCVPGARLAMMIVIGCDPLKL